GNNWGLEASRFPSAWNVLDKVRSENASVDTIVYDLGFDPSQEDLPPNKFTIAPICGTSGICTTNAPSGSGRIHGTHVAAIVGAAYDDPGSTTSSTGVVGSNPAAHIFGVPYSGAIAKTQAVNPKIPFFTETTTAANWDLWQKMLDEKRPGGQWPNLRVINMS